MNAFVVIMVVMVLGIGAVLAATPQLMPPTECFAVTVPPSAQDDPRIRSIKRTYAQRVGAVSIVCALGLAGFGAATDLNDTAASLTFSVASCMATLLPCVFSLALMLRYRTEVRALKQAEGWTTTASNAATVVGTDEVEGPISLLWNLLYLPLIAGFSATAMLMYDRFPDQIPMQAGFDGVVTRYVPKSPASALFPVLTIVFFGMVMTFVHWGTIRSKRPIDPAAPVTSAYAYGIFARVQSIILLVGGLVICLVVGMTFYLSILGNISMGTAAILVSIAAMGLVGAEAWLAVTLGQSGGKLAAQLRTSDEIARDDDAYWPLGMFYSNREDPSIMVPKRFGVGWTLNLGRLESWALMALLVVVTVAFVLATNALVG